MTGPYQLTLVSDSARVSSPAALPHSPTRWGTSALLRSGFPAGSPRTAFNDTFAGTPRTS